MKKTGTQELQAKGRKIETSQEAVETCRNLSEAVETCLKIKNFNPQFRFFQKKKKEEDIVVSLTLTQIRTFKT